MASQLYLIGTVFPYAGPLTSSTVTGNLEAAGFLLCDGRPLSKKPDSPYYALFRIIGVSFGGDDANFYIPDLRGRFVRATDNGAKRDPDASLRKAPRSDLPDKGNAGDKVGSVQEETFPTHDHTYQQPKGDHICNLGSQSSGKVYQKISVPDLDQSGLTGGNETRPINQYINYLIAYK